MNKKNIVILSKNDQTEIYLPLFWASAKTYYELNGSAPNQFNWVLPEGDYLDTDEEILTWLSKNPPDLLGISLYMWNFAFGVRIAQLVKQHFPKCIIVTGGPQQYFKHDTNWFVNHKYFDASLPGDEYGERTLADILDQFAVSNTVNWSDVNGMVYPAKNRKLILTSKKSLPKKTFNWNYSPYQRQFDLLEHWTTLVRAYRLTHTVGWKYVDAKIETTRGCPYSCTYCDWGGGVNSKVISKDVSHVESDISALSKLKIKFVYICDANFGILGERDYQIVKLFAKYKKQTKFPTVLHMGGFAKTVKALPTVKKIIGLMAESHLDYTKTYKVSIQSLDKNVLDNIKRTDIPFREYVDLAIHMRDKYGYRPHTEVILGLPGQTVDNFYSELETIISYDFVPQYYHWNLLPETPAYSKEYRKTYDLQTVTKIGAFGNSVSTKVKKSVFDNNSQNSKFEIVKATSSYTEDDYVQMYVMYGFISGMYYVGMLDLLNLNEDFTLYFKKIWKDAQTSNHPLLTNLKRLAEEFKQWINQSEGNGFYVPSLVDPDTMVPTEIFWVEYVFLNPAIVGDYFTTVNVSKNLITKDSYTYVSNEFWLATSKCSDIDAIKYLTSGISLVYKPRALLSGVQYSLVRWLFEKIKRTFVYFYLGKKYDLKRVE